MQELIIRTRREVYVAVMFAVFFGMVLGAAGATLLWERVHTVIQVPHEAMKQARHTVEEQMRAACGPWFTDKKRAGGPGSIVACRDPGFLTVR